MTLITFQDGKVVMRDGQVGTEQDCCCNEGCDCLKIEWDFTVTCDGGPGGGSFSGAIYRTVNPQSTVCIDAPGANSVNINPDAIQYDEGCVGFPTDLGFSNSGAGFVIDNTGVRGEVDFGGVIYDGSITGEFSIVDVSFFGGSISGTVTVTCLSGECPCPP